jgi:DNA-binding response OmpR family regulator
MRTRSGASAPVKAGADTRRVLVVDTDADTAATLEAGLSGVTLLHGKTLAEAQTVLASQDVDVALIAAALPDGDGMTLARDVIASRHPAQAILIADKPSFNQAIDVLRLGAADLLVKPLDARELIDRVQFALARQQRESAHTQRLHRLRRVCKKLNHMREEVTQQVDILCNDLITAYQELASQMANVSQANEFGSIIKDELDLEKVLRRTLEYLVNKAGPTNAAIFLPSSMDEFTLGGYVNYDCDADSADVLLDHMADIVAPRISERETSGLPGAGVMHLTDNESLVEWIGDDAAYFEDSHVVGFACKHEGETLAVLVLFRDGADPFTAELLDTCDALAPALAAYLARIIRIHHRQIGGATFGGDDEEALPF